MSLPEIPGHGCANGFGMLLEKIGKPGAGLGSKFEGDMEQLANIRIEVAAGLVVYDCAGKA